MLITSARARNSRSEVARVLRADVHRVRMRVDELANLVDVALGQDVRC